MSIRRSLTYLCDLCHARTGLEVAATHREVPLTVDDVGPATLDLCTRHYAELVEPLRRALADHGADPDAPRAAQRRDSNRHRNGPILCRVRGCHATPLAHRGTLWQHVRRLHEITLEEYVEQYGEPVPMTPEELAELVVEIRCEQEDCEQVYSTELGHRWPHSAFITHMWSTHGIKVRPGAAPRSGAAPSGRSPSPAHPERRTSRARS